MDLYWPCFVGCKVQIDPFVLFTDEWHLFLFCAIKQSKLLAYITKCSVEADIEATYLRNNGLSVCSGYICVVFDGSVTQSTIN